MAKKADIDLVKLMLKRNEIDSNKINKIIQEINSEIEAQQEEEKPKPVKKQYVVLASDPEGKLKGVELTGWVLQIPEDETPFKAFESLKKSAYDFNSTPKGRKLPLETIGEACECVSAKIAKENELWIKTKHPIFIQSIENKIPTE